MEFFDAFMPVGRTNMAIPESPCTESQVLNLMDSYGVAEAMVFHTLARDSDPDLGNVALAKEIGNPRLHRVWAFDSVFVKEETPEKFLEKALQNNVKAIMFNPHMRDVQIDRSIRLRELAALLEKRRIPLLATYRKYDAGQDTINWYQLADFCNAFPQLPVISWEWRSRANRPMFDALASTKNLRISFSSLWQAQMLEQICESFGAQRLVFSLGLPLLDPGSFTPVIAYAGVAEAAKNAIASNNIRQILREANYE